MKRTILIVAGVLFAFIIISLFSLSSSSTYKNFPSRGNRIIAFGDSLVEGVGATKGHDLFSVLSGMLGEPIDNYGRGGDTTRLALQRLPQVLEEVPHPKVAVIILGGNDYLQKIPIDETFSNLAQITKAFQDHGAVVMILGVRGGVLKDNFNDRFQGLSDEYKVAYIPDIVGDLILFDRGNMYDSIHPNDNGYKIIAERVYPLLKKISE